MAQHLTYNDTKKQSLQVFGQFGHTKWIPQAEENAKLKSFDTNSMQNIGLGKTLVIVAMGASLEDHIETLKKYRDQVDILCCDKAFVPLMDRGVKPDYVMICDSNIPARFYESHVLKTRDIKLIATPYANTLWTKPWLGPRYFYINKDSIQTEEIFLKIMPGSRVIPASSNVSNAMVVFMLGADEIKRINWAGYERYLLVGFDYSWRAEGNYYAWDNPIPKRYYMNNLTKIDFMGNTVLTSHNLLFSVSWLTDYLKAHRLPVFNCSGRGLLKIPYMDDFEKQLKKINTDKFVIDRVKDAYQVLQSTMTAKVHAQKIFDKSREAILCQ